MTKLEIIERLKANRKMGTIYFLLPEPVKDYLLKHKEEKDRFLAFDSVLKEWCLQENGIKCLDTSIYALSDLEPHWEEFNIKNGIFKINCNGYYYWEVERFLSDNEKHFNAFGGWFCEQDKSWNLAYQVQNTSCSLILYYNEQQKVAPVIPTKIRFWRYRE